jgi:hypothetical protein
VWHHRSDGGDLSRGVLVRGLSGTFGFATRREINLVDVQSYSPAGNLLAAAKTMEQGEVAVLVVLVLWGPLNVGGIFEHRAWALASELLRLPVTGIALALALSGAAWHGVWFFGLVAVVTGFLFCLLWRRGEFERAGS